MNIQYVKKKEFERLRLTTSSRLQNEISKKFHILLSESSIDIKVFSKIIDRCVTEHMDFSITDQVKAFAVCRIKAERMFLDELTKLNRTNLLITNRENMKSLNMIVKHSIQLNSHLTTDLFDVLKTKREFDEENNCKNKNNRIRCYLSSAN